MWNAIKGRHPADPHFKETGGISGLVGQASAFSHALHLDPGFMAEPGDSLKANQGISGIPLDSDGTVKPSLVAVIFDAIRNGPFPFVVVFIVMSASDGAGYLRL
jgi:hypothetical protein